ncbi:MAG: ABC transporter transmembrane domain-containing protein, partial [Armatimonadota bacterium]|nr:ABC transporter transmembrane domain-containing protein [Armatimonadota bacterium]
MTSLSNASALLRSNGLRRLLPYVLLNWQRLFLGVLCALAATSITYLTVKTFGSFADAANGAHFDPVLIEQVRWTVANHRPNGPLVQQLLSKIVQAVPNSHAVDQDAGVLALLFLAKGFFSFGQSYLVSSASQKVLLRLRNEVYAHLQQMGLRFFDRRKT